MNDPKERIKKLRALALRGVGGEKEQAQAILDELLKKYDLTLDDIDDEEIKSFDLEFHGKEQMQILIQTVYKVTNETGRCNFLAYTGSGRACRTKLRAYCTEAQKHEITFLFEFYTRLFEKDRAMLLKAFIQKHKIFGELKEGEEATVISDSDYMKMQWLMCGMSNEKPLLQITDGQ